MNPPPRFEQRGPLMVADDTTPIMCRAELHRWLSTKMTFHFLSSNAPQMVENRFSLPFYVELSSTDAWEEE